MIARAFGWWRVRECLLLMAANLKKSSSTGKLLKNGTSGNLIKACAASECSLCTAAPPASVTVTLGGSISNGTLGGDSCTNCNSLLAAWVLPEVSGCFYQDIDVGTVSCGGSATALNLEANFQGSGIAGLISASDSSLTFWFKTISPTYDCSATHVLPIDSDGLNPCDMALVTYTLN